MAATTSAKSTTGGLAVPDQHNPPPGYEAPIICDGIIDMRDVMVPMRDGKHLCVDIYRPNIDGKFPALLAIAPHNKEYQTPEFAAAVQWAQPAWSRMWFGGAEGGDSDFLVRRGYVHVCGNIRGTGKSDGGGSPEWDMYDLIEWIAKQPWCDGSVGMIGISAFGGAQFEAAAQQPPSLKAIFPHELDGRLRPVGLSRFLSGRRHPHDGVPARWRRRVSRQSRAAGPAHRRSRQALARGHEQSRPDDVSEHLQHHRGKGPDHAAGLRYRAQSLRPRRHRGKDQGEDVADQRFPFTRAPAGTPTHTSCTCKEASSGFRKCRACQRSFSSADRRIWNGHSIPSTTKSCAGTTIGSKASTAA